MSAKAFSRGQTQVLYRYLPESIFLHDDYGLCKVVNVSLEDVGVNKNALFDALTDALSRWRPEFCKMFPDARNAEQWSRFEIGTPREVRFAPYPLVFACRTCHRVAMSMDLERRFARGAKPLCTGCGGKLVRLAYVQAHNCGRIQEVFVPKGCPKCNSREHLALYDPGRVWLARWKCVKCNLDVQAMRMTPCKCDYSASIGQSAGGGDRRELSLRIVPTGDPSLYAPHTFAFVNFSEEGENQLKSADDAIGLLLARAWGILDDSVGQTIQKRRQSGAEQAESMTEVIEALRQANPDHPLVKQYDERKGRPFGQEALDEVAMLLADAALLKEAPRRWLVEHVTLLENADLSDTASVARQLRGRGDEDGAKDIETAQQRATDFLGLSAIRIINDFPLALCAFGYTRISRDPSRTVINTFPMTDKGRIPIYAMASETEALWFQLDPASVVKWLADNAFTGGALPTKAAAAWAWLYRNVPGLRQSSFEPQYASAMSTAVRTLLHTMSHVFLRRIEWSGFSSSSIGEYLIPGSLSFILYANRVAETKIGGLTTLFEQRLNTWLWDAVQSGHDCVYDPLCGDEGGSCAGCTHREHNCPLFNRELSRAMLYGGPTPSEGESAGHAIRAGYWVRAWDSTPAK